MWKYEDIITQSRYLLQDSREPYRHTDEKLVAYLNSAISDARRLRPDLFFPTITDEISEGFTTFVTTNTLTLSIPFDDSYFTPFVEYIVGMASAEDDEFVNNNRAGAFLTRFAQKLTGKGA
jgi:hypothetical protein